MSKPKKPGTDLAALKARLAKKNKKAAEPAPAPEAAPAPAPEPVAAAPVEAAPAAPAPAPEPATAPQAQQPAAADYAAPAAAPAQSDYAAAPVAQAAPAPAAPVSDDPFGGGGGGGFDPSDGLIDAGGGEMPSKGNAGLAIFVGILGIGLGAIGGFFVSKITRKSETNEAASAKGAEMAAAVQQISDARIDVSKAMGTWEEKMATDPAGAASEIDTMVKESFAKKVNVDQLFGWQLAAIHSNGVRRTFELYDEATRLQKDLGYLSAFLSSQEKALKSGGGPSQFAVKFTDKGAVLVAAVGAVCAAGEGEPTLQTAKPCPEGKAAEALGYTVLESLGSETKVFPKGAAPGQVTLLRAGGAIYDYAVGMEPNRNAMIMRNALLKRAKDHLESMNKAEKAAIKALENFADNPNVDGSAEQPDPEAG
ncbi:MAG: hypothetical protein ACRBN8_02945 [Nannocystales bacterium]